MTRAGVAWQAAGCAIGMGRKNTGYSAFV